MARSNKTTKKTPQHEGAEDALEKATSRKVATKKKSAQASSSKQSSSQENNSKSEQGFEQSSLSDLSRFTPNEDGKRIVTFPLITLRNFIITPCANVNLVAARENTVQAIRTAAQADNPDVVIFSQIKSDESYPDRDHLHKVGLLARVLSYEEENGNKQFRATVRGFARVSLNRIVIDEKAHIRNAEVEILPDVEIDEGQEKRYLEAVRSAFHNARALNAQGSGKAIIDEYLPSSVVLSYLELNSLSQMCDALAQVLLLPYLDKKFILESRNPIDRARALIAFLNGFSYKSEVDRKIAEEARESMERNQRDYYLNEQLKAIKRELNRQIDDGDDIEEFRNRLARLDAPVDVINRVQKEISRLAAMPSNSSETTVVRTYIDTLFNIPWHKSSAINHDLSKAKDLLEAEHYGLRKVKDRILEYLAVYTRREILGSEKNNHSQILCLMGPPGIGKTSLAASIAKATGRKYVRIALGGMYDEAEIRGHRRTYIGAMPGRIVQGMIKVGVNNPLFLLDEIDKVSQSSYHGDISAALLEVLDPEQNKTFNDNYVDLDYDLSNVFFIATANSYNIPPALIDRMEIIDLSSYTDDEKFHIAREHLLKKQIRNNGLSEDEFDISDDGIYELINHYTMEAGVRNLERIIGELCRKTVKAILLNNSQDRAQTKSAEQGSKSRAKLKSKSQSLTAKDASDSIVQSKLNAEQVVAEAKNKDGKVVLGPKEIAQLIGPKRYDYTSRLKENRVGIVNGLSVSSYGGDMLQVEVMANEGKGAHVLTGQLGSVMKESVTAAISLVRSHAREFNLAPDFYQNVDLHVHFPEGAIKKDGPSAGIATVTAIVSALTGNPVRSDVAMTGEITLRGDVLMIGGLKEKLLAALRGGVKTVCIPQDNAKDLWDMPEKIINGLKIIPVKHIDEVLNVALEKKPSKFMPTTAKIWTFSDYEERMSKKQKREAVEERKMLNDIATVINEEDDIAKDKGESKKRKRKTPEEPAQKEPVHEEIEPVPPLSGPEIRESIITERDDQNSEDEGTQIRTLFAYHD